MGSYVFVFDALSHIHALDYKIYEQSQEAITTNQITRIYFIGLCAIIGDGNDNHYLPCTMYDL